MRYLPVRLIGLLLAASASASSVKAEDQRPALGRMFSPVGTILVGGADKGLWEVPQLFDDIPGGRVLLALPGARGIIDVKEGDVHLTLAGNLPELSPAPVLETAVILHDTKSRDMDLTLQRGRILIENHRKDGTVKLRLHIKKADIDISLAKGGAIALEAFARCAP